MGTHTRTHKGNTRITTRTNIYINLCVCVYGMCHIYKHIWSHLYTHIIIIIYPYAHANVNEHTLARANIAYICTQVYTRIYAQYILVLEYICLYLPTCVSTSMLACNYFFRSFIFCTCLIVIVYHEYKYT